MEEALAGRKLNIKILFKEFIVIAVNQPLQIFLWTGEDLLVKLSHMKDHLLLNQGLIFMFFVEFRAFFSKQQTALAFHEGIMARDAAKL